jgi:hypothetical protein
MFSFDKPSNHDGNPLDCPESAEAADGIGRHDFHPARPANIKNAEGSFEQNYDQNKEKLTDLNTYVKKQKRQWNLRPYQPDGGQPTGKTEAVQ